MARRPDRQWTVWRALVPAVALAAGLLFATSANLSHGSDLRSEGTNGLVGLVRAAQGRVATDRATVAGLDAQIKGQTDLAGPFELRGGRTAPSGVAVAGTVRADRRWPGPA